MTFKSLEFALELSGVTPKDIERILSMSKKNGIFCEAIDAELVKMGYDEIFDTEDYSADDDDFGHIEKFPCKHKFLED